MDLKGDVRTTHRRSQIMVLGLAFLLFVNLPFGAMVAISDEGPTDSRYITACSGSQPPPADVNGERWGDWLISCPALEPVNLTFETVKLHGNITLMSGSHMRLQKASSIELMSTTNIHYYFDVQGGAQLVVMENSEIRTDRFTAMAASNVTFQTSNLYAKGLIEIDSGHLDITDSHIENRGHNGAIGQNGASSQLTIQGGVVYIFGSTMLNFGGYGGDGDATVAGGNGGPSDVMISSDYGLITGSIINNSGGNGGSSLGSTKGLGFPAGKGGRASTVIKAAPDRGNMIWGSSIFVNGGNGGKGSDGSSVQGSAGGNGGWGEVGGDATLLLEENSTWIDGSDISVIGGNAGKSGSGGSSAQGAGGNGSNAKNGGDSNIQLVSHGPVTISDSIIVSAGGTGGDGGFFGHGRTAQGTAGYGGDGGAADFFVNAQVNFTGSNSSMEARGGKGGQGGLGVLLGGDGGLGGDATLTVNTTRTFVNTGLTGRLSRLGGIGGEGGKGGDLDTSVGTGSGVKGRGGPGGTSVTTINSPRSIDLRYTRMTTTRSLGGPGERPGLLGFAELLMNTTYFNSTDGCADWSFEVPRNDEKGELKNTSVENAPQRATVEGSHAKVEVWNWLSVAVPESNITETWEISVYQGPADEGHLIGSSQVTGPHQHARFLLLTETIDWGGSIKSNFTVIGRLIGSNVYTKSQSIVIISSDCGSKERAIDLIVSCYTCVPPNVMVISPKEGDQLLSTKLKPCRAPTPDEISANISPPGCLRIEGNAYTNIMGNVIDDIKLWLIDEKQETFFFRPLANSSLYLLSPGSSQTKWFFDWEVAAQDHNTRQFIWDGGKWTIKVSVHATDSSKPGDTGLWSETGTVNITVLLTAPPVPASIKADAGLPEIHQMKSGASGVKVTFKDAKVHFVSGTRVKVIRMEWDYNNDGNVDWAIAPTNCTSPQDCQVPPTTFIYTKEGYYDALFCAVDNLSYRSCDSKKVEIVKEEEPVIFGVPRPVLIAIMASIVVICSIIISALVITSLSEATKYSIMAFILVPLYTRLKKEEMLDNYTRGEIRGYIVANPGAHYSRIKRDLSLNNGTLIYHLSTLEREGFIYSHRDDYYRRFYPRGRKPRPGANLTTVQETIIETLLDSPGLSAEELAPRLNKSRKVTNYHLVWLRRWGLVEAKDDGRRKTYTVIYEDETEKKQDGIKAEAASEGMDKEDGPSGP